MNTKKLIGIHGEWVTLSKILPNYIAKQYRLHSEVTTGIGTAQKGIYIDIRTKKYVFIKIDHPKLIEREYRSQQYFYKLSKQLKRSDVIIPKPITLVLQGDKSALIMEHIPKTRNILNANLISRVKAYTKILIFMHQINKLISITDSSFIMKRSPKFILICLFVYLLKNILNYPRYIKTFIAAVLSIFGQIKHWLDLPASTLCHGDVNVTNILTQGRKYVLLDFFYSRQSHQYYDISQALNSSWYCQDFHSSLLKKIISEFNLTLQEQKLLKTFVLFNLMQRLSQHYSNPKQEEIYLTRLYKLTTSL